MTVKIINLASKYDIKDTVVIPPNLKSQGNREASFVVCPFTAKLRKTLQKSLLSKQWDPQAGWLSLWYVTQFRNKKNTTQAIKKIHHIKDKKTKIRSFILKETKLP